MFVIQMGIRRKGSQNRNANRLCILYNHYLIKMFLPSGVRRVSLTQDGKEGLEGSVVTFWAGALDLDSGHELVH